MAVALSLVTHVTADGVPVTGLAGLNLPTAQVRNVATGAIVLVATASTEVGDGAYRVSFTPTAGVDYSVLWDHDPQATGAIPTAERYRHAAFSEFVDDIVPEGGTEDYGTKLQRIDAAVSSRATQAEILSDATPFAGGNIDAAISSRAAPGDAMTLAAASITAAVVATDAIDADALAADAVAEINAAVLSAIAGLNDLAQADILSDATPFPGANVDAAISSRATQADILSDATPFAGADIAAILLDTGTTIPGLVAALNDIDQADVQAAMTAQGYTSARATLLDNLDAAVSGVAAGVWAVATSGNEAAGTFGKALTRLFGEHFRTRLFYATAAISTGGREVPQDAVSHMEVQTRDEAGAFPGSSYFVVFGYEAGDSATAAPRVSNTSSSAPVDGTFSSTGFPT